MAVPSRCWLAGFDIGLSRSSGTHWERPCPGGLSQAFLVFISWANWESSISPDERLACCGVWLKNGPLPSPPLQVLWQLYVCYIWGCYDSFYFSYPWMSNIPWTFPIHRANFQWQGLGPSSPVGRILVLIWYVASTDTGALDWLPFSWYSIRLFSLITNYIRGKIYLILWTRVSILMIWIYSIYLKGRWLLWTVDR